MILLRVGCVCGFDCVNSVVGALFFVLLCLSVVGCVC